jgi:signal transduction histidine kinase
LAGILQNIQVMQNRFKRDMPRNREAARQCGTTMEAVQDYIEQRGIATMMDSVMESGRRAAQIVENMLSFSRKSESKMVPHDLGILLDKTVELASNDYDLKKKYDFRSVEIVRQYDADVPNVPCEHSKIQQVFLNILKNGAQAMAECRTGSCFSEKPAFFLRIKKENGMARIEIEDNGPGMDENTRKRVFEPFFTTKGVGTGTGLGLSVSYFIITENHKGTMAVESTPGKGTTFILRLPIKQGGQQ